MFYLLSENRKCTASLVKLKIDVPEEYSIEAFKELVLETLLYPGHWITKKKTAHTQSRTNRETKSKKSTLKPSLNALLRLNKPA